MTVDFDGLRRNLISSFNDVIKTVKKGEAYEELENIEVNGWELDRKLGALKNDIVMICALINPETGKGMFGDESPNMGIEGYDFDCHIDGEYEE